MEKHEFASISLTVRDRAISSKFSTTRVSHKCTLGNCQKIFLSPKNGGHFEFLPKMAKHKFTSISLTLRDRAISSTHRVSHKCTLGNFQNIFPSPKMAAILNFCQKWQNTNFDLRNVLLAIFKKFSSPQKWWPFSIFEFLPKMEKHKFASVSLTVQDERFRQKFSTPRVSEKCTWQFSKNFPLPKMAAILYFRIFAKKWKNTNLLLSP